MFILISKQRRCLMRLRIISFNMLQPLYLIRSDQVHKTSIPSRISLQKKIFKGLKQELPSCFLQSGDTGLIHTYKFSQPHILWTSCLISPTDRVVGEMAKLIKMLFPWTRVFC